MKFSILFMPSELNLMLNSSYCHCLKLLLDKLVSHLPEETEELHLALKTYLVIQKFEEIVSFLVEYHTSKGSQIRLYFLCLL